MDFINNRTKGREMGYIRETYIAGKTIVVRERMKRITDKGKRRAPKTQPTSEKVWLYNLKQAIFKLTLVLNNNFKPQDHHLQLTYKLEPECRQEAKEDRRKFLRKLSAECKKSGLEFKWVAVTERTGGRFHHHIVCSNIPVALPGVFGAYDGTWFPAGGSVHGGDFQ